ncbi:MAG: hypothetical protein M3069_12340 [Chloroflexota bacterium]|nr:hypothetical protein [Chloroflexota bacterium]
MHDIKRGQVVIGQLMTAVWTTIIWASLLLAEARGRLSSLVLNDDRLRARSAAQGLVEWSLAAAVLAFVGIAAWQLAGTAITDAINRTITSLNKAGS